MRNDWRTLAKKVYLLAFVATFLGGCVSPQTTPSREEVKKIGQLRIVPIEAHPLGVPPGARLAIWGSGDAPVVPGINVVGMVLLFAQMPDMAERGGKLSGALQAALNGKGVWVPTVALAEEAQAQLASHEWQVSAASEIKRLSDIEDRSYTVTMENWMAPIRAWYNSTDAVADYRSLRSDQRLYVIEVGVINYEITRGRLLLQVAMKLIDTADGQVIGRARAWPSWDDMPVVVPLDQAFANEANRFKQAFNETAKPLVMECLTSLGLLQ